jgi:tetraacyldisaccharide 4'-kinase
MAMGADLPLPAALPRFDMQLQCSVLQSLAQPELSPSGGFCRPAGDCAGWHRSSGAFFLPCNSKAFFAAVLAFPDHHVFTPDDLPGGDSPVIVTSKDAVKLRGVIHDAAQRARLWILPVTAQLTPDLAGWLLSRLKIRHGR